ncbi:MAG: hypothetical protein ABIG44_10775 [Planctomycetota bacterium]
MSADKNKDEDETPEANDGVREDNKDTIPLGKSLLAVAIFVMGGFILLAYILTHDVGDMKWEDLKNGLGSGVLLLVLGSATLIHGAMQVRRRKLARKYHREDRCPHCGYPRRGLPEPRCPECGRRLPDPDEDL